MRCALLWGITQRTVVGRWRIGSEGGIEKCYKECRTVRRF